MTPKILMRGLKEQLEELQIIHDALPAEQAYARRLCRKQMADCRHIIKMTRSAIKQEQTGD